MNVSKTGKNEIKSNFNMEILKITTTNKAKGSRKKKMIKTMTGSWFFGGGKKRNKTGRPEISLKKENETGIYRLKRSKIRVQL